MWGSPSCPAVMQAADGAADNSCCCTDSWGEDGEPASDPCRPVDSDPDCVCHGAVVSAVGAKASSAVFDSPVCLLECVAGNVFAPVSFSSRGTAFSHAGCHFAQAECGRQVCAHASRLVI